MSKIVSVVPETFVPDARVPVEAARPLALHHPQKAYFAIRLRFAKKLLMIDAVWIDALNKIDRKVVRIK